MNYQSGDKLKNRYLSNDAFTSLKNKLGGRSITSLGMRRKNSYRVANQGLSLFEYKSLIYKFFISTLLIIICLYIIPQTRYFLHGKISETTNSANLSEFSNIENVENVENIYNIAPAFLKTDSFIAKQKEGFYINDGIYVYDNFTKNIIGLTENNSSSTINIKLFSDAEYKNNFLIQAQSDETVSVAPVSDMIDITSTSSSTTTESSVLSNTQIKNYQSYVFEGVGYGQIIAKVPPKTAVKKDGYVYIRTIDGLKPVAKIVNVDEDNKSTFTIVYAQLLVSPQNIYQVFFK